MHSLKWLILTMVMMMACQLVAEPSLTVMPSVDSTELGGNPLPTADFSPTPAPLGQSRQNPLLIGSVIDLPNWEVEVLEIGRGQVALDAIYAANGNNEPPMEGMTFVLLKLAALKKRGSDELSRLTFGVTGDQQRLYYSFLQSVVAPEPRFPYGGDIVAGERVEGWQVFVVGEGEQGLLLQTKDSRETGITWFLQLEPDARQDVPAFITQITPTENGMTPKQAAIFGNVVTSESWQLQINHMVQGEEAWQMVYDTNQFNDPPPKKTQYVALEMTVHYIGINDSRPLNVSHSNFHIYDNAGNTYDAPALVNPQPKLEAIYLYPGGETTGWVVLQMPENIEVPVLIFTPPGDNGRETRYFSLQTGR